MCLIIYRNRTHKIQGGLALILFMKGNQVPDPKPRKNPIAPLCKKVLQVTDEDIAEIERIAKDQMDFVHPLKNGTASRLHRLGEHNLNVLEGIRALRETIRKGEAIYN